MSAKHEPPSHVLVGLLVHKLVISVSSNPSFYKLCVLVRISSRTNVGGLSIAAFYATFVMNAFPISDRLKKIPGLKIKWNGHFKTTSGQATSVV